MAEKKSAAEARIEQIEKMKKQDENPVWKEMLPVFLPRTKEGGTHQFVGINGRTFLVKRGEQVMVPKPVYEVLTESMAADDKVFNLLQGLTEKEI